MQSTSIERPIDASSKQMLTRAETANAVCAGQPPDRGVPVRSGTADLGRVVRERALVARQVRRERAECERHRLAFAARVDEPAREERGDRVVELVRRPLALRTEKRDARLDVADVA